MRLSRIILLEMRKAVLLQFAQFLGAGLQGRQAAGAGLFFLFIFFHGGIQNGVADRNIVGAVDQV